MGSSVAVIQSKSRKEKMMDFIVYIVLITVSAIVPDPAFLDDFNRPEIKCRYLCMASRMDSKPAHWENFRNTWNAMPFSTFLLNSLFIVVPGGYRRSNQ